MIGLNESIAFFEPTRFSQIDWQIRQTLRGQQLAQWLHGFYATHAKPLPMKIETLHKLCGIDFLPALKSGDSFFKTAKSRSENVHCRIGVAVVCCAAITRQQGFRVLVLDAEFEGFTVSMLKVCQKLKQGRFQRPRAGSRGFPRIG